MENIPGASLFLLFIPGSVLVVSSKKDVHIWGIFFKILPKYSLDLPRERWHWLVLEEHCLCEPIPTICQNSTLYQFAGKQWFKVWTGCDNKNDRNDPTRTSELWIWDTFLKQQIFEIRSPLWLQKPMAYWKPNETAMPAMWQSRPRFQRRRTAAATVVVAVSWFSLVRIMMPSSLSSGQIRI